LATFQVLSPAAIENWAYSLSQFGSAVDLRQPVDGGEPEHQIGTG